MPETLVNMRQLKNFAVKDLPFDWILREILLSESDEIPVSLFLARLPLYLKISGVNRSR